MTAPSHWPVLPLNDMYRADFEAAHVGRNLKRHHLRGTYVYPVIAALWNQHVWSIGLALKNQRDNPNDSWR